MSLISLGCTRYLLAFVLMFFVDVVWAAAVRYAVDRRPIAAAAASGVLFVLSSATTLVFVADAWCLATACLGGCAGTYVAVRVARR